MKLKFLTNDDSIPSIAVSIPTRAIMPMDIIIQVITVRVILPRMEVNASFIFWNTVIHHKVSVKKLLMAYHLSKPTNFRFLQKNSSHEILESVNSFTYI
jgi:hypothetical protein